MMDMRAKGMFMQLASGTKFYPGAPLPEEFKLFDLASGLSKACRFNGQCHDDYKVAEHSVLVSYEVEKRARMLGLSGKEIVDLAFEGLWHDGTEALMPDLTRPWKKIIPEFVEREALLWSVMAPWLGVPVQMSPIVKAVDDAVLMTEAHVLHVEPEEPWTITEAPADVVIRCLLPAQARAEFLSRHFQLARARGYVSPFYRQE
jgi:hypothetical protein